ncbi:hypothetical protein MIMGU_mgv1a018150mg, partial [Erythranthe guttata]
RLPPPPPSSSSPFSITTDKEALLSLKSQFHVEIPNNPLSTWDQQNLSPCNWSGVSCSEQRVTGLDLSGLGMTGSISPYLGNLSSLRSLHLQNNQLTGKIPSTISGCRDLTTLELMQNRIWGSIPHEISQLMQLQILNLGGNQLSGEIPSSLTNISSLVDLNLGTNNLGGSIPSDLWRLSNLKFLDLTINNLSGTVPPSIYNMSSLVYVALASNNLWGELPPDIGITLPNLLGLDFCFNKFTGNLSKVLTKLYMGGNDIHGTIPSSIGELRALDLLNMSYCSISGEIPAEIGLLNELRVLGLAGNKLSGKIPNSLGNLQHLIKIDLSRNKFVGSVPNTFTNLQNLISIDLSDNMLNGSIPIEILNLPKLSVFLNLSRNQLTGSIPVEIGSLENIAVINICDNMLSGSIPSSIGRCKSLEHLSFARNMLSGPIPDTLGLVRGLETLDLSANQLSGKIPLNLQNLQSLQFLNLSFNNLEGEIPAKKTMIEDLFDDDQSGERKPQIISYKELCFATDNFGEKNLIGYGSFGFVYRGVVQGVTMAVKVLNTAVAKPRKTFLAECGALRYLRHRNLVKLVTACSSLNSKNEEFFALVFEFMSNGSLDDWITGKRKHANGIGVTATDRLKYAIGIASAIDYLHNETEVPIVHCDLKPSNVLLDSDMTPKVADFGLAKLLLDDTDNDRFSISCTHTLRGSIGYIPPEYGYGERPSTAGDVYSYGILLLELFTGKSPTCDFFTAGLTLKSWVENQFLTDVEKVLELGLVEETNDYWEEEEKGRHCSKLESWRECLTRVVGIGLSCAAESADARISIKDALRQLKNVEEILDKHRQLVDDGETIYIDS